MNIRDFGDVNERLNERSGRSGMSTELINFVVFALTVMVSCIIFIVWG